MKKAVPVAILASVLSLFSLLPISAQSLVFGTYPFGDSELIYRAFSPLVEHIAEETGVSLRLVVTRDYQELSERLVNGSVDIAWIGSANYVKTRREIPDIHYLATYLERDASGTKVQPFYQSVIVTLQDAPYESLTDLEGARFGFTSPDSTSGYAYPRMILEQNAIEANTFFGSVFFLGRHTDVVNALIAGSLDAGAISDGTFYNAQETHDNALRPLVWSEPIPLDAIVAAPHVSRAFSETVRTVITAIPEAHPVNEAIREVLRWPAAGFETRSDAFYDTVETALGYAQ